MIDNNKLIIVLGWTQDDLACQKYAWQGILLYFSVTVAGQFAGLLLQARKADGSSTQSYGTFSVNTEDNVKLTSCGTGTNNAVTHSSTAPKTDLKVTWKPPSEDVGTLEFVWVLVICLRW